MSSYFYIIPLALTGILQAIANILIGQPFYYEETNKYGYKNLKKSFTKNLLLLFLTTILTLAQAWCWQTHSSYWPAYGIFFAALTITVFTDVKAFLISRYVTLYLVPLGWALSNFKLLPIGPFESILGSIFGLLLLSFVRLLSRRSLKQEGIGQGDIDLLAFIGAFTGPFGCWASLMIGSLLACFIAAPYALITKNRNLKIPFGIFLSLGAISFIIFQKQLLSFFILS